MRSSGFDPVLVEILNRRLRTVTIFVLVIISALILRLWFLQIANGLPYRTQSENNRIHLQTIPPFRGMILDRNGELLVDNRPSYNLYVIPEDIQDRKQLLTSLKLLLDIDPEQVGGKLGKAATRYPFKPILIKKNITRNDLAVVETNLFNLPGIMIEVSPQRNYIFGNLASHVIGYLGEISEKELSGGRYPDNSSGDLIGKSGVEGRWQNYLNGITGGMQVEVDAAGRKLRVISRKPPASGLNISLTIDKNLQLLAEESLKGKEGSIVALDPNSGEVLAMASSPSIDSNLFIGGIDEVEWERMISGRDFPLQNRAISGQYPPGSVFKIVVALAGLEEGIINPEEEIVCTGSYTLGDRTYRCWKEGGHGNVGFHRAIRESCDVYFYKIGSRLGVDKIAHYARMCGLGAKTTFELDSEAAGLIPTSAWKLKRWGVPWQLGETVSTSIGQGFVLVTPLQMARLISLIYNGGKLYQPKIVRWIGSDKDYVYEITPTLAGEINVRQESLEHLKKALFAVVNEPHGTGYMAKVNGINVAGKTGTAQVVTLSTAEELSSDGELPEEFRDHAWFVSIAPEERPRLALAILIEHGEHGGSAAAPIAREMIKEYLDIDQ
ncbi:penicillin-binding protein 2 [Deltaproteobacteria bacterium]|nr:penicillin-binding protein 2 [Deltaproteobacteria bacterium]